MFRNTRLQHLPLTSALYRLLSRSAYGGGGNTVVTFRGVEYRRSPPVHITTLPSLADGTYEADELDRFLATIKQGATVADVGANIGMERLLLARAVGPQGTVYAFERSPTNASLLKSNLARNTCTNVVIVHAAVGSAAGHAMLDTTSPGATHRLAASGHDGDTPVDLVALDEFVESTGATLQAVKVDIEGFEPVALAGMSKVLSERPLLPYRILGVTGTGRRH